MLCSINSFLERMMAKAYSYIRFSTPDQLRGDSLRRQLEASRKWADENGYDLDETLRDLGVSAFRGKNRTEGALRTFLDNIESGEIEKGSILVMESLDRLSRDEILESLSLFTGILAKGIKIVTLVDGQEYTRKSVNNINNLVISLVVMARAHEESATKSKRLSKAWENKRANINDKKLTSVVPAWLQLNPETGEIEKINKRVKIVQEIFEMTANKNMGKRAIVRHLNKRGIKPWGPARKRKPDNGQLVEKDAPRGWRDSYIQKILENRAVIGEFQPHTGYGKNRKPIGPPIKDYYPSALEDESLFFRALTARQNRQKKGGRKGLTFSNLFTGFAFCADCGSTMRFVNKGSTPSKGGTYLACDSAIRNNGCSHNRHYNYQAIEDYVTVGRSVFFDWTERLFALRKSESLADDIAALEGRVEDFTSQILRYNKLLEGGVEAEELLQRYIELTNEREDARSKLDCLKGREKEETSHRDLASRVMSIITDMKNTNDDLSLYEIRSQVSYHLSNVIHSLQFSGEDDLAITILPRIEDWPDTDEFVERSGLSLDEARWEEAIILSWNQFRHDWMPERPKQPRGKDGRYVKSKSI
ncbi:MAG: recombinase family protein [Candidatus Thiodiazotropha sp.]